MKIKVGNYKFIYGEVYRLSVECKSVFSATYWNVHIDYFSFGGPISHVEYAEDHGAALALMKGIEEQIDSQKSPCHSP